MMNHSHIRIVHIQTCTTISPLDERSEEGVVDVSPVEEACSANDNFVMVNGSDSFITQPPQEENMTLSATSSNNNEAITCQATDESNSSLIVVPNSVVIHDELNVSFDDGGDTNIDDGGNRCQATDESNSSLIVMSSSSIMILGGLEEVGNNAYISSCTSPLLESDKAVLTTLEESLCENLKYFIGSAYNSGHVSVDGDINDDSGGICATKGSNGDGDYGISCGKF